MKYTLFALLLVRESVAVEVRPQKIRSVLPTSSRPVWFRPGKPTKIAMKRAGRPIINLRKLPSIPLVRRERPDLNDPDGGASRRQSDFEHADAARPECTAAGHDIQFPRPGCRPLGRGMPTGHRR